MQQQLNIFQVHIIKHLRKKEIREIMNQQENPTVFTAVSAFAESKFQRKKRFVSSEINFAMSLRPIYRFSRAFGLMPFTIVLDEKCNIERARVRTLDILWCIIAIGSCIVMAVVYYKNIELPKGQNVSIILVFGDAMLVILGLIYACTVITLDMINRFKLIAILKSLNNFDTTVCKLHITF